jgi:hypothetical protein
MNQAVRLLTQQDERERREREREGWRENSRASKGKRTDFLQHLDKTTTSFFFSNFSNSMEGVFEVWESVGGIHS